MESESDIEGPNFLNVTDLQNAAGPGPFGIEAQVSNNYGVQEVWLFYSVDNGTHYDEVMMKRLDGTSFFAEITPSSGPPRLS